MKGKLIIIIKRRAIVRLFLFNISFDFKSFILY